MKEAEDINNIKCTIFQSKNESMERITEAINDTQDVEKKADLAERLLEQAEDLLSCDNFNEKKLACRNCHYIAKLRRKTANLIIGISDLAQNS